MGVREASLEERYGCVVLPQFAAQALRRGCAGSRGGAMVVMEGARPMEVVVAMNRPAAALGLRERMTRVEVETFGEIAILDRNVADEEAAKQALREVLGGFTPRVEERQGGAAWECVLDLCGTERLLGEPAAALGKLRETMAGAGFEAAVVLCGNADAGLSLARAGRSKVVEAGKEARALADLRVVVLGLEEEQEERFAAWGIRTLGELAALPEAELIARMGQAGRELRLRALGRLPHHLEPAEKPFLLEETLEFDEPVEMLDPLLFCLNVMLERLVSRALERALALASVTVSMWMERCGDRVVGEDIALVVEKGVQLEERSKAPTSKPAVEPRLEHGASGATGTFEARLGLASADAAVRKAWHRAALTGERLAVRDEPPVRGEALRERLGIGDGQAMRRKAAALHLVREDKPAPIAAGKPVAEALPEQGRENRSEPVTALAEKVASMLWGQAFERTIRPAVPVTDRSLLLKMLQLDLEAHPAPGAVIRLQLSAESGRAGRVQMGLFAPPMPEPTRFEDTHARLVSLVGERNVGRARPLDTHAPERFDLERFRLPAAAVRLPRGFERNGPGMTLRRMRPPLACHVVLDEKRIERLWFEGTKFEVERCYGPWRTSGEWWGEGVWSLDVWDVAGASKDGDLLILMIGRDLLRSCWSVNGIYD